ncbi:choice-of-anchor M domain-containing protein [Streptomyces drozdowiczii]|uniref:choice-of-anchor M domain-containing protein n=1 Tax=Streptomyces drozdowiczii TaxID=202862 RepID=UPI0022469CC2|nr:choice-of-anchor M domain-containing protein [Streptomyces drozdowiczii]MCX0247506.1 choice-of-anchor M domain-containing protein [Streptomyces drozdowiczii]
MLALSLTGVVSLGTASGAGATATAAPAAYTAGVDADSATDDVRGERIVIDNGHVDAIAPRMVDGSFRTLFKDSRTTDVVWREPSSVIMHLTDKGALTIPEEGYDFLGAPGDVVHMIPQTQNPDVLWAGWSTEAFGESDLRGPFELTLRTVEGPGALLLFGWSPFGEPEMKFDSRDGLPDAYTVPARTHEHSNWAFTQPGVYRLGFTFKATLASGEDVSDTQTFTMAVGDVDVDSITLPGDEEGQTDGGTTDGGQSDGGTTGGGQTDGGTTGGGQTGGGQDTAGSATDAGTGGGTSPHGELAQTGAGVALPLGASGAALLVAGAGAAVYLHRRRTPNKPVSDPRAVAGEGSPTS